MEGDTGNRTLLHLVSDEFYVINLFVVDEHELGLEVTNIVHHPESYSINVEAGTNCDNGIEANDSSNDSSSDDNEFDLEELELIRLQKKRQAKGKQAAANSRLVDETSEGEVGAQCQPPVPTLKRFKSS
ncbi:hypothetical protein RND71_004088 [Anisodus tanguticus]|uniref:Uncharacterized protein n=1 Tax=Anisodus tanguticus TaxID=243964 RepID=A0AAE1SZ19_9SOLA|nr:hypothetical protein RND71_004088 [Anisodus tanguticus]